MKVLKNGEQKNVVIDNQFYARSEIIEMLENGLAWFFYECGISRDPHYYDENGEIRTTLHYGDELKVEYNKMFGCYETVLIKKDGTKIHVIV